MNVEQVTETRLSGVLVIQPRIVLDERGQFFESWHAERYAALGIHERFVQDNVSVSRQNVVRGLHFQSPAWQAKLVGVLQGRVFDVAVDLRVESPTFRQWTGMELSAADRRQLFIPRGFAHGFAVLSDLAVVAYKCSAYHAPAAECVIRWNDPELAIDWPVRDPILSSRDAAAPLLRELSPERFFGPIALPL